MGLVFLHDATDDELLEEMARRNFSRTCTSNLLAKLSTDELFHEIEHRADIAVLAIAAKDKAGLTRVRAWDCGDKYACIGLHDVAKARLVEDTRGIQPSYDWDEETDWSDPACSFRRDDPPGEGEDDG